MTRSSSHEVHLPNLLQRLLERIRGREQFLVRPDAELPLLLINFPRGRQDVAREVEASYLHTFRALPEAISTPYMALRKRLPALVVVLLRPENPCGCLGHHHVAGTESRLTRRLAADFGGAVGEIDLAYESIRQWQPKPLSNLAAAGLGQRLESLHFEVALLTVLLHELEHLASPEKAERDVRLASNQFYESVMDELVSQESGRGYGIASPPPRP